MQANFLFIDFHKAFDSISHSYPWEALKKQGINGKYIRIIKNLYQGTRARVKTDKTGGSINIERGVRQGDPLSPNLFNCILEEIFRRLEWEGKGIKIDGEHLNNLRFADDVVLISDNIEELEMLGNEFVGKSLEAGLEVNKGKTCIISNMEKKKIKKNSSAAELR